MGLYKVYDKFRRYWRQIHMLTIRDGWKKMAYIKKHGMYGAIGSIRSVFKKGGAALFTSVANTFFNKSVIVENVTYGTPNARAFFLIFPMCFFTFHSFGAVA